MTQTDPFKALADAIGRAEGIVSPKANAFIEPSPNRSARPRYAFPDGFFSDEFRRGFLVGRCTESGEVYHMWLDGFDFMHGNEQFFEPEDPARIKLRPLIASDRYNPRRAHGMSSRWFGGDVNSLLWVDHPDGSGTTVFLIHLFPRGDCEDPKTIARAIGEARQQYEADFPAAVALLT